MGGLVFTIHKHFSLLFIPLKIWVVRSVHIVVHCENIVKTCVMYSYRHRYCSRNCM